MEIVEHPALRAPQQRRYAPHHGFSVMPGSRAASVLNAIKSLAQQGHRGISLGQIGVLLVLASEPQMQTVRDLAARLRTTKPSIVRALDALGKAGMIQRVPDERDRRSILVEMLEPGWKVVDMTAWLA